MTDATRLPTFLITGANGLLGQKLVGLLAPRAARGELRVVASSRGANKLHTLFLDVPFVTMDVTDPQHVRAVLGELAPTHVIHTAAMTNVDACETDRAACWLQNTTAVEILAAECAAFDAHLTHVSTDFIFDGEAGPYDEEAAARPVNYYGESKLAAEAAVQAAGGRSAIVRTVLVYGTAHDYGRSNIVLWVRDSLRAGKSLKVVDDQWRTPSLAEDLADGCLRIAERDAQGIFNISSDELLTPYQMATQVADFFGLDKTLLERVTAATFTQPARRPPRTGLIIDKARRELGYAPRTFQEGIRLVDSQS
ncbi:MAG: SDR family oxidoreductase [Hymenobacteraceae bacterium]|nr:SDR family oxidoreductase [Hymenobacteraceae bacterium]